MIKIVRSFVTKVKAARTGRTRRRPGVSDGPFLGVAGDRGGRPAGRALLSWRLRSGRSSSTSTPGRRRRAAVSAGGGRGRRGPARAGSPGTPAGAARRGGRGVAVRP